MPPEAAPAMHRPTLLMPHASTVFLDRDGVINRRRPGDYVKRWDEFEFLPGAVRALAALTRAGVRTIVTTNQRGIARGLYTEADLAAVHDRMRRELATHGAAIDAVYHCPDMDGPRRKPRPGMLLDARRDFPGIEFRDCVMIGDSPSDIQAGAAVGCPAVLVGVGDDLAESLHALAALGITPALTASSLEHAVRTYPGLRHAAERLDE